MGMLKFSLAFWLGSLLSLSVTLTYIICMLLFLIGISGLRRSVETEGSKFIMLDSLLICAIGELIN